MNLQQFFQDDDFEGEHEALDNKIRRTYLPLTDKNILNLGPIVLVHIVRDSKSRLLSKYTNIDNATKLIRTDGTLQKMMIDGWECGFKCVRLYSEQPSAFDPSPVLEKTPRLSRGGTRLLLEMPLMLSGSIYAISARRPPLHLRLTIPLISFNEKYYAQYCAVLQSSGMGKSRAVDEMSKEHFVIPVVLREPEFTGHPPSDLPAFNYLINSFDVRDAFIRSCGFLHALFCEAAAVLRSLGDSAAANSFREYMRKDMDFKKHGGNRVHFYQKVIDSAKDHATPKYLSYFSSISDPSDMFTDNLLQDDNFPLRQAFRELCEVIQPRPRKLESKPLVIVAFDEIQNLARTDNRWFRFGELRHAIRGLRREPFFALFLSTSAADFDVTPVPTRDVSARMLPEGNFVSPFCELGFGQLAKHLDFSKTVTLSQVTSLDRLASYGRPLWNAYVLDDKIIQFATFKLLGGYAQTQPLSIEQQFACLAQRVPIKFLSGTSQTSSDQQKEQVHSHLRVLLKVDDGLETMVTTFPSEPILSEAAYSLMTSHALKPAQAMQNVLKVSAVDKGELGELLVALLFVIARDKAVGPADDLGRPLGSRWCPLLHFLSCLFCPPSDAPDAPVVNVQTSLGWCFLGGDVEPVQSPLAEVFEGSKVYFTHFIQAQKEQVVGVRYLMRLMARGAALLCATGQDGVDGIIPFLLKDDEIRKDNIGVIMFRCTNDVSFTDDPEEKFVCAMDPRTICDLADVPVIRVVFALAAPRPALRLVLHTKCSGVQNGYTAYDFWVAGFSPDVLLPIKDEPDAWSNIMRASNHSENIYASDLEQSKRLRMAMDPGVAASAGF